MNANLTLYLPQVLLTWKQFLDVSNPARQFLDIFDKVKRKIRNFPSPENSFVWKHFFSAQNYSKHRKKSIEGAGEEPKLYEGRGVLYGVSGIWLNFLT